MDAHLTHPGFLALLVEKQWKNYCKSGCFPVTLPENSQERFERSDRGKLNEYGTYVPHFLNLKQEDFQKNIDTLVRHKYLRLANDSLSLNIRPLRYGTSLSA
jgi:hypothetical protein